MIALLIGTSAIAGVGMGWYGHKAGLRIKTWGQHANERDLIFQAMSEPAVGESRAGEKPRIEESLGAAPFVSPHFHV